jgi:hypothetical protein
MAVILGNGGVLFCSQTPYFVLLKSPVASMSALLGFPQVPSAGASLRPFEQNVYEGQ